jgi:hypothetical protein
MKKTEMLRVRFSEDEWEQLGRLAEEAGLSRSALVRDHLGKVRVRNRDDERQRVAMLNRINANLNMIARWCNTHKGAADTVEVVTHLAAIQRAISGVAGYE